VTYVSLASFVVWAHGRRRHGRTHRPLWTACRDCSSQVFVLIPVTLHTFAICCLILCSDRSRGIVPKRAGRTASDIGIREVHLQSNAFDELSRYYPRLATPDVNGPAMSRVLLKMSSKYWGNVVCNFVNLPQVWLMNGAEVPEEPRAGRPHLLLVGKSSFSTAASPYSLLKWPRRPSPCHRNRFGAIIAVNICFDCSYHTRWDCRFPSITTEKRRPMF